MDAAKNYGMIFKETSAKMNVNVQQMFNEAVDILENNNDLPVRVIPAVKEESINIMKLPDPMKKHMFLRSNH